MMMTILKQDIKKEHLDMDPRKPQNDVNVVSFCQRRRMEEHVMYFNMIKHVSHFFHLVNFNDVDGGGTWDCKNIMGICSLHFAVWIFHKDITLLKLKDLTFFYNECIDDNPIFCEKKPMYDYGGFIQGNK